MMSYLSYGLIFTMLERLINNENLTILVYDIHGFSLCFLSPYWGDVMLYLGIPLKRSKTAYTGFSKVR